MCCERLLCAACAGPVVEGRCPVCVTSRARVHAAGHVQVPDWLVALAVLVVTLTMLLVTYTR